MTALGAPDAPDPLDAALSLLDRQIVDRDNTPIGKVDDIAIRWDDRGPMLTHLLVGPGAWAGRMPGLFGRIVHGMWRRLRPEQDPQPVRIPLEDVERLDSAVHLRLRRDDLRFAGPEAWVRRHVIEKLPGARHEP